MYAIRVNINTLMSVGIGKCPQADLKAHSKILLRGNTYTKIDTSNE